MRLCVQRVTRAAVKVGLREVGRIDKGLMVLVGFCRGDTQETAARMARKLALLRVFEDQDGKMNLNVSQVNGSALVVSQFTLYADCRKGNRPSFSGALPGPEAKPIYDQFVQELKACVPVQTGVFGAKMEVELINDGPVTLNLDSAEME